MQCIIFIYLGISENSCISGINLTWLWCRILLICCWIWFFNICWTFSPNTRLSSYIFRFKSLLSKNVKEIRKQRKHRSNFQYQKQFQRVTWCGFTTLHLAAEGFLTFLWGKEDGQDCVKSKKSLNNVTGHNPAGCASLYTMHLGNNEGREGSRTSS